MEERKDLYLVDCSQGPETFPPLSLFKQNTLPFHGKLHLHDVTDRLIEWPVKGTEEDFIEVLELVGRHKESIKTAYITQPFPGYRAENIQFFRMALTQLDNVNLKLLIRSSADSNMKQDLVRLKGEFAKKNYSVCTVAEGKLSSIILLYPRPSAAPNPADSSSALDRSADHISSHESEERKELRSSHSSELSDIVGLPRFAPIEESKIFKAGAGLPSATVPLLASLPSKPPTSDDLLKPSSDPRLPIDFHEEDYRCIICLSIFRDPFTTSCCNAIVCQLCSQRHLNRCPQCRQQPFSFTTNLALNRIFEGLKEKCSCGEEVSGRGLEDHKKVCPKRTFKCPCGFEAIKPTFIAHLKEIHREIILCRVNRLKIA